MDHQRLCQDCHTGVSEIVEQQWRNDVPKLDKTKHAAVPEAPTAAEVLPTALPALARSFSELSSRSS